MTYSNTRTSTFTTTNAEYLASKVAADLKQMQYFYGSPDDNQIYLYIKEVVILLLSGCLKSVKYGFKKNGNWIIFLEYKAYFGNIKAVDEDSGRVFPGSDTSGADWHSFLDSSYSHLSTQEQARIKGLLPFQRTVGAEPRIGIGRLMGDKYYSSGNGAFQRNIYY